MDIDRKLQRCIDADPDAVSDLVLSCSVFDATVRSELEKTGMHVRDSPSTELGIVSVSGKLRDVARLSAIPQVLSVELDEEQQALG